MREAVKETASGERPCVVFAAGCFESGPSSERSLEHPRANRVGSIAVMNTAGAIPTAYLEGYEKARMRDPEMAANYISHTVMGDPVADAVIEGLATLGQEETGWLIKALMEQRHDIPRDVPKPLQDFFEQVESSTPSWFDPDAVIPGCRAFHANSDLFIGAFVSAVLIEGFATLISKSFFMTGRVSSFGVRRLKQNNRHLLEIFLPGGLDRHGDGWKLSVRIRLIHAQIRRLLKQSSDWDTEAWGVPVSSAHVGFAAASFSARLLDRVGRFGVVLDEEERKSFTMIWRYTAHLMGVPESILFRDEQDARNLYQIGDLCEPPPDIESIVLANGLINSAPLVAGIVETKQRRKVTKQIYRVARAQIGDEMADQLRFPHSRTWGLLAFMSLENRFWKALGAGFPTISQKLNRDRFRQVMDVSVYDREGITYKMPVELEAELSGRW